MRMSLRRPSGRRIVLGGALILAWAQRYNAAVASGGAQHATAQYESDHVVKIDPASNDSGSSVTAPPAMRHGAPSAMLSGNVRWTLLTLALPVLAEQLLNTVVGLFDTFLAGRIDAAATAAIGLASYVSWFASLVVMLVGTGTTALVSRSIGAGDEAEANRFANQSISMAAMLGVVIMIGGNLLAPWLVRYANLRGDAAIIATEYLQFDAFGNGAMALTIVGCAALRGGGNMRTPMWIYAAVNVVNVVVSTALVFGIGPVPRLGITGIVAGTVVARAIGAIITVALLLRGSSGLRLCRKQLRIAADPLGRILAIGMPAAADGALMWIGHMALIAIIGRISIPLYSEASFAAHVVAIRVEALTYLPAVAWAAAVATMIGQSLGAQRPQRAIRAGHEGVLQCGLLSVVIAGVFFVFAEQIYGLMSRDALVRAAGVRPFRVIALLQPCLVMSIVYIGGLRGAGATQVPLLITTVGVLCVRVPLGYYFGIVCSGGLMGAWIGMCGDMVWRATAARLYFSSRRWLNTQV